jgi:hypothetical protein
MSVTEWEEAKAARAGRSFYAASTRHESLPEAPGGDEHYRQGDVQPVDLTLDLPHWKGQAIKYVYRAGLKGDEREDIEKAIWFLNKRLERLPA